MAKTVRAGDSGTKFSVTIEEDGSAVDVSGATKKEVHFRTASGAIKKVVAAFETDGTDGIIFSVSTSTLLNEVGIWRLQGYVELPAGTWHSSSGEFVVQEAYC